MPAPSNSRVGEDVEVQKLKKIWLLCFLQSPPFGETVWAGEEFLGINVKAFFTLVSMGGSNKIRLGLWCGLCLFIKAFVPKRDAEAYCIAGMENTPGRKWGGGNPSMSTPVS